MTNRPKNIGTAAETAVVRYLRENGFPDAKRLTLQGASDIGDISLGDGWPITIEVKGGHAAENASDGQVQLWLNEAHREMENAENQLAVLVLKRKGKSAASAGAWWVVMDMGCYLDMLDAPTQEDWVANGGMVWLSLEMLTVVLNIRADALRTIGEKHG